MGTLHVAIDLVFVGRIQHLQNRLPALRTSHSRLWIGRKYLHRLQPPLPYGFRLVTHRPLRAATFAGGFTPVSGDTFKVLTFASAGGTFSSVGGVNLPNGLNLTAVYDTMDVTLDVS